LQLCSIKRKKITWYKPIEFYITADIFTANNCNILNKIQFKMSYICRFCKRTFSTRSGLSQHVKYCIEQSDNEESSLISDIDDMSLGSEGFPPNIEEVKKLIKGV